MRKSAIRLGAKCTFVPACFGEYGANKSNKLDAYSVTGTITYINHAHRFFRVEYRMGKSGTTLSECFKF